jgi:uncharacterized Zn ribbon protein
MLALSQFIFAQKNNSITFEKASLDINNIKANINANGNLFYRAADTSDYELGFEFPMGSGKHTMLNSTLWIGGLDENDKLRLAGELYNLVGHDYWNGPLSVDNGWVSCSETTANQWNKVWKLSAEEIAWHIQHYGDWGYIPTEHIATWPAHGDINLNQSANLAPFVDVDNDQIYNPMNGDYPLIKGDQCIYFIFNDVKHHSESNGDSLGLEIHGMAYAFNSTESEAINSTIFVNYKIYNRSNNEYHDTYIGAFADMDIGYFLDDYFATEVQLGAIYQYNGDGFDEGESGYGSNPPAQAMALLAGPLMIENNLDDPSGGCDASINGTGFGDGIVDNERLGLTGSSRINNDIYINGLPHVAQEYYNILSGKNIDGQDNLVFCDDSLTTVPCKFVQPANSDPCYWGIGGQICPVYANWSDETGNGGFPNPPGERSGVAISGPFTFKANSVQNVDLAFVSARDFSDSNSVALLKSYLSEIKNAFNTNPKGFGDNYVGIHQNKNELGQLFAFPNPAKEYLTLSKTVNHENEFVILDSFGRVIKKGKVTTNLIPVSELKPGIYSLTIKSRTEVKAIKFVKE